MAPRTCERRRPGPAWHNAAWRNSNVAKMNATLSSRSSVQMAACLLSMFSSTQRSTGSTCRLKTGTARLNEPECTCVGSFLSLLLAGRPRFYVQVGTDSRWR
jgi:hypothetical protein